MPINDKQRDDLVSQKTLDMIKKNFNQTANQNTTTLQSKHPLVNAAVGLFGKILDSLNKDNPNNQSTLQQDQQKNGKSNLSMMIPNMLMQIFMQQLSKNPELQKLLQPILGQAPNSPFAPRSPFARPRNTPRGS